MCGVGGVGTGLRERMCRRFARKWFPERFYRFTECAWSHLFSASSVCTLSPPFTASLPEGSRRRAWTYLWIPLHKTLVPGNAKQPEDTTIPSHSASMRTPGASTAAWQHSQESSHSLPVEPTRYAGACLRARRTVVQFWGLLFFNVVFVQTDLRTLFGFFQLEMQSQAGKPAESPLQSGPSPLNSVSD